ncbi:MAG TPA: DUF6754 domain-containing protein [Armatimonadota bacterium]|jgi:hypothetical protein
MDGVSDKATPFAAFLGLLIASAVLLSIRRGRRGKELFLRRIPGLNSVDEAAGRATEMGRPMLYAPGIGGLGVVTFASLALLQHVARIAARMGTRILVSVCDPAVFPVAEEVCRQAYEIEGRPEAFRNEDVRFLAGSQFPWAMATMGLMGREKPASAFWFGAFAAESLMIAESANQVGAIQVAGTPNLDQIPFFVAACDYTVFGEEYYAASAYISRDPVMTGSLVGQDIGKLVIMLLIIAGVILSTVFGVQGNPLTGLLR